jgi:acyl-CoA thioesterase II
VAESSDELRNGGLCRLLDVLDLEQLEVDLFRGRGAATAVQRVFGGQVAGQALVAAGRTVDADRPVHSLHSYFLRPGDPSVPIIYHVERLRDGGSFSARRVATVQHGAVIFVLSASFQVRQPGLDHEAPSPEVPAPESLPSSRAPYALLGAPGDDLEFRHITPTPAENPSPTLGPSHVWFRSNDPLPEDPLVHVCVATYASDLWLLDTALLAHGRRPGDPGVWRASLDHAMWFHRAFRVDDWILYTSVSPSAAGGRALVRGEMRDGDGRLLASTVQEGLIRAR